MVEFQLLASKQAGLFDEPFRLAGFLAATIRFDLTAHIQLLLGASRRPTRAAPICFDKPHYVQPGWVASKAEVVTFAAAAAATALWVQFGCI